MQRRSPSFSRRTARNFLLGIPARAKSLIPGLSVGDLMNLHRLIREALTELGGGKASVDRPTRPAPSAAECAATVVLLHALLADVPAWPRAERDVLALATGRGISSWTALREAFRLGITMQSGRWSLPAPRVGLPPPCFDPATSAIDAVDLEEACWSEENAASASRRRRLPLE